MCVLGLAYLLLIINIVDDGNDDGVYVCACVRVFVCVLGLPGLPL